MDIQSYSIWNDYIQFLRNVEAVGNYAENQRITAVRKIYQRGVVTPMLNIEQLWKDYVAYEMSINTMIAEKMQQVILQLLLMFLVQFNIMLLSLGKKQRLHECKTSSKGVRSMHKRTEQSHAFNTSFKSPRTSETSRTLEEISDMGKIKSHAN